MANQPPLNTGGKQNDIDFRTPAIPTDINTDLPNESLMSASYLDVAYANQSEAQKMDVYVPADGSRPYPVIAYFHGGGWLVGDKRWGIAELAGVMLTQGYAVASINHRPSSEAIFPAQIYDAKAAIRWLRANATRYGIDPDKIVAWGGSSGGHIAALLGTSAYVKELEDLSMGNPEESSRVNAVVDISGPVDFLQLDAQTERLGLKTAHNTHDVEYGPESRLLGGKISEVPDRCRAASPMTYIRADSPPFYIQHAQNDEAVPYLQSVNLAAALRAFIGADNVWLETDEVSGHGIAAGLPSNMERLLDFLNQKLS